MSKTKRARPVSFNSKNKEDVEMTEFLKDKPFSTYVKKLIKAEMERQSFGNTASAHLGNTAASQNRQRVIPASNSDGIVYSPMLKRR